MRRRFIIKGNYPIFSAIGGPAFGWKLSELSFISLSEIKS